MLVDYCLLSNIALYFRFLRTRLAWLSCAALIGCIVSMVTTDLGIRRNAGKLCFESSLYAGSYLAGGVRTRAYQRKTW